MKTSGITSFLFFICLSSGLISEAQLPTAEATFAQQTITGKDSSHIIHAAENIIQISFSELLNFILNSSYSILDKQELIRRKFSNAPNAKNPVFINKEVTIENDLDPSESEEKSSQNDTKDMDTYLHDFLNSFERGEENSTEVFHTVLTTFTMNARKDTATVNVNFEIRFKRKLLGSASGLPLMAKKATVYVLIKGNEWTALIAGIRHNLEPDTKSIWGRYYSSLRRSNRRKNHEEFDEQSATYVENKLKKADEIYFSSDYTSGDLQEVKALYEDAQSSDISNEYITQRLQNISLMIRYPDEGNENIEIWKKKASLAHLLMHHQEELHADSNLYIEYKNDDLGNKIVQLINRISEIDKVTRAISDAQYSEAFRLADILLKSDPTDFEYWYLHSLTLVKKGDNDGAMKDITSAIRLNPEPEEFYATRGGIYIHQQNYEDAKSDFSNLVNKDSTNSRWLSAYAECFFQMKDLKNAEKYFTKALIHDVHNGRFMERLGDCYREENNWEEACKHYRAACDFLNEPIVSVKTGYVYSELNKPEVAADYFEKALNSQYKLSDSLKAYIRNWEQDKYNIGLRFLKTHPNDAFNCFKSSAKLNPNHDSSWYYLGKIKLESKKYAEAKNYFDTCLNHTSAFFYAIYERGQCKLNLGDYKGAQDDLYACLDLSHYPALNKDIYNFLGDAITGQGRLDEANKWYSKSLSEKKEQPETYLKIGKNIFNLNPKEAFSNFEKAIDYQSNYADAYFWRGKANVRLLKFAKAIEDFHITRAKQSAYPQIFFELGNCYYHKAIESQNKEDWDQAIKYYADELENDVRNAEAYLNKATCEMAMAKFSDVCQTYETLKVKCKAGDSLLNKNDTALYNFAYSKIRIQEDESAKSIIDRGIKLFPHSAILNYTYACYYADKKDITKAVQYLDAVRREGGALGRKTIKGEYFFEQLQRDDQFKAFLKKL